MNLFGISGILNFFTSAILAIFLFANMKGKILVKLWAWHALVAAIWGLGTFFISVTPKDKIEIAYFWWQCAYVGLIFLPALYYHFVCEFIGIKHKKLFKLFYGITSIFFICNLVSRNSFLGKIHYKFNQFYWTTEPGPILWAYVVICVFGIIIMAHIESIMGYLKINDRKKRLHLIYFIVGGIVGWLGGWSCYLENFDIGLYPVGNFCINLYPILLGYAIYRHQLLDIEVIIKKTLVFAGLLASTFAILIVPTLLIQEYILRGAGTSGRMIGLTISGMIIILSMRRIETFLIRITDRYLFQKKYDYRHLIRDFMDELKTMVLNVDDVAQSTIDFLNSSIRPATSAIFMYNKFSGQYDIIASNNLKDKSFKIPDNSPIVKTLAETGKIIGLKNSDSASPSREKEQLLQLGTDLIIPLLIHKELIGLICLGNKKSDENYSDDDIDALSDLSGALAISLNNAQLFGERADAEKRALVGTIATGIHHEIGNPLNIITIKLDTFRILAKQGMLEKRTKEELIADISETSRVCLDNVQRIAEITKQVSEFAKPDKKLVFDKVGLNETVDETIAFLKHGMILDSDKIEKRIAHNLLYALVDRGQLKQIMFNLIKNASHAIDSRTGKIMIDIDKGDDNEVSIKITDNGHGMSKEIMNRVFTPFFTTKEPGRGTGLGLALVKIMTERNGGKITVESEQDKGTTFTLVFRGGLL